MPPADSFAERGAERNAEHIGERETSKHHCDRLCLLLLRHQSSGDHGSESEECAVTKRCYDSRGHQQGIIRGQSAKQITENEGADQQKKRLTPVPPCRCNDEERSPERDAQRIAGHKGTGLWDSDAK